MYRVLTFVVVQLVDDVLTHAGVVHQTHKGGAQLHIGDVLRHVPAHTAMHLFNAAAFRPPGM